MSLQEFLPTPKFDDYKEFFKDFFTLERRDDGVLLAQAHTRGGSVQLSVQNHRALGQFLKTAGADPENEVLILTGTGPDWMMGSDPAGFEADRPATRRNSGDEDDLPVLGAVDHRGEAVPGL
jgi:enoyl-CoA hydratase/carnithine racemase